MPASLLETNMQPSYFGSRSLANPYGNGYVSDLNFLNSCGNGIPTHQDDQRALQLALELSVLQLNGQQSVQQQQQSQQVSSADDDGSEEDIPKKRSQNTTECVPVPSSEHVAEIVGRQGCKIKALRAKTNTYIKTPVRGDEPVFVVTGRREDVALARHEILSAADHFSQIRATRRVSSNGPPSPTAPGQVTLQVRVPYRVVGLVVGPKGATIKRIQQNTHTYIVTPSRDKEPIFEVTGLPENAHLAKEEIESHIAMRTGASNGGGEVDFLGESTSSLEALAPIDALGSGGWSQNTMMGSSNAAAAAVAAAATTANNAGGKLFGAAGEASGGGEFGALSRASAGADLYGVRASGSGSSSEWSVNGFGGVDGSGGAAGGAVPVVPASSFFSTAATDTHSAQPLDFTGTSIWSDASRSGSFHGTGQTTFSELSGFHTQLPSDTLVHRNSSQPNLSSAAFLDQQGALSLFGGGGGGLLQHQIAVNSDPTSEQHFYSAAAQSNSFLASSDPLPAFTGFHQALRQQALVPTTGVVGSATVVKPVGSANGGGGGVTYHSAPGSTYAPSQPGSGSQSPVERLSPQPAATSPAASD